MAYQNFKDGTEIAQPIPIRLSADLNKRLRNEKHATNESLSLIVATALEEYFNRIDSHPTYPREQPPYKFIDRGGRA